MKKQPLIILGTLFCLLLGLSFFQLVKEKKVITKEFGKTKIFIYNQNPAEFSPGCCLLKDQVGQRKGFDNSNSCLEQVIGPAVTICA